MNSRTSDREQRRVSELARQLKDQGYDVELSPHKTKLPPILRDYTPDIIARSGEETLVIEVRSRNTFNDIKRFAQIAEDIRAEPGWRFELVVTNPVTPETGQSINLEESLGRLLTAKELADDNKLTEASLLLAWSAIEPLIRTWANQIEGSNRKRTLSAGSIAKTAYSLGIVDQHELTILEDAAILRNSIAHGFESRELSRSDVQSVVNLGLLLIERASTDLISDKDLSK